MSDSGKIRLSFAEAIITQLWFKGLITASEREAINSQCYATLNEGKC